MMKIRYLSGGYEVHDLEPTASAGVWEDASSLREARRGFQSSGGLAFHNGHSNAGELFKMSLGEAVERIRTQRGTLFVWDEVARFWCEAVYLND